MKVCSKCGQKKPIAEFAKNSTTNDGLQRACRPCHRQYVNRHYAGNKDYYVAKAQRHNAQRRAYLTGIALTPP